MTKISFCCVEEKNQNKSLSGNQNTASVSFKQGARLDEKQVVSICTFDIASEITGQSSTEIFVLHRGDLYEHHPKLLIQWMYSSLRGLFFICWMGIE